ncbi:DUF1858 domain-containing protein [Candidatus Pacearchaeota archaeon]|nr:DUF1858 domain-containing protein [Candidatus Pacearchaeota archaeon]
MVNKKNIIKTKKIEKDIINKHQTIAEAINKHPEIVPVFLKHGLSCIGCPFAISETIEQGADGHGINVENLIKELNQKVKKGKN